MRLRVYLDTSVFSATYDSRLSDRKLLTEDFWNKLDDYEASTSETAREEIELTEDAALRARLRRLLERVTVHETTTEMWKLASRYVSRGIFSVRMYNDSLHVAAAVLTRQDVLLSWNFKHLVNRRRRSKVNQLNTELGLPLIEILAPPEL